MKNYQAKVWDMEQLATLREFQQQELIHDQIGELTKQKIGFIVYSSGATGYANNLVIKNNGSVGIGNSAPWAPLNVGDCRITNSNGFINFGKRDAAGSFRIFNILIAIKCLQIFLSSE